MQSAARQHDNTTVKKEVYVNTEDDYSTTKNRLKKYKTNFDNNKTG